MTEPRGAAPKFDFLAPTLVTSDELEDLSEFFGVSQEVARDRLKSTSVGDVVTRWSAEVGPSPSKEEMGRLWADEEFVWIFMQWHASPGRAWLDAELDRWRLRHPPGQFPAVLEYGCGVGTDALRLAAAGYRVTLADLPTPMFEFARQRFKRRGLAASFVDLGTSPTPGFDAPFDALFLIQVLQHMDDPRATVRRLAALVREGGLLVNATTWAPEPPWELALSRQARGYNGIRWQAELSGLGWRFIDPITAVRVVGVKRRAEYLRYLTWRATGLWIERIGRPGGSPSVPE
jgi:SAM-dependent methyltransferase